MQFPSREFLVFQGRIRLSTLFVSGRANFNIPHHILMLDLRIHFE